MELENTNSHKPPYSLEAEQAVLGAVLRDNEALHKALEIIEEGDFYKKGHQLISQAMWELSELGEPIDLVTLQDQLKRRDRLGSAGGVAYLSSLIGKTPTAGHVRHHAKIVREKSVLRALIRFATETMEQGYDNPEDAEKLLSEAESAIFSISQRAFKKEPQSIGSILKSLPPEYFKQKLPTSGITTGFEALDDYIGIICEDDLTVVAGKEGIGKSAFCHQVSLHVIEKIRKPVLLWSGEMNAEQVAMRMVCSSEKIDSRKVRSGRLDLDEHTRYNNARTYFNAYPFYIDDSPGMTVTEIISKARKLRSSEGLGLLVIDNITLLDMTDPRNLERSYRENITALRRACAELKTPIIVVGNYKNPDKVSISRPPENNDIYGGSAIRYAATNIFHIYSITKGSKQWSQTPKDAREVFIGKARFAPWGIKRLGWESRFTCFGDYVERVTVP